MLPYAPTTIDIERPTSLDVEPYSGEESWSVVATDVRAAIGTFSRTVSATEIRRGGEQSTQVLQLTCDIPESEITHHDRVRDKTTGILYDVHWAFKRIGIGLDHYTCEIGVVEGLVSS